VQLDALVAEAARGHELARQAKGQRLVLDLEKGWWKWTRRSCAPSRQPVGNREVHARPHQLGGRAAKDGDAGAQAIIDVIDSGRACRTKSASRSSIPSSAAGEAAGGRRHRLGLRPPASSPKAHGGRISVVSARAGDTFALPCRARPARSGAPHEIHRHLRGKPGCRMRQLLPGQESPGAATRSSAMP